MIDEKTVEKLDRMWRIAAEIGGWFVMGIVSLKFAEIYGLEITLHVYCYLGLTIGAIMAALLVMEEYARRRMRR